MALERFLTAFAVTDGGAVEPGDVTRLAALAGGRTFGYGLYRIHTEQSAAEASQWVRDAFPEYGVPLHCFGFDWMGRQFATAGSAADPEVVLVDVATDEVVEIPVPFSQFHDHALVDTAEDGLAVSDFQQWLDHRPVPLAFTECVGYNRPLFLGGADDLTNLEVTDLEVYWHLTGQILLQVRNLPPGTDVSRITIQGPP